MIKLFENFLDYSILSCMAVVHSKHSKVQMCQRYSCDLLARTVYLSSKRRWCSQILNSNSWHPYTPTCVSGRWTDTSTNSAQYSRTRGTKHTAQRKLMLML